MYKNCIKLFSIFFLFFVASFAFAKTGEEIYNTYCVTCHAPKMAPMFQAPAFKNALQWEERKNLHWEALLEKDSSLDSKNKRALVVDALVASATAGTSKGMPPKGTCLDCSYEDLKNAILFMTS